VNVVIPNSIKPKEKGKYLGIEQGTSKIIR
jgi:hypothetical protein